MIACVLAAVAAGMMVGLTLHPGWVIASALWFAAAVLANRRRGES